MSLEKPFWFAGSGSFGAHCLSILSESLLFDIVITAPPRPAGRNLTERETPVETKAVQSDLCVIRTADFNKDPVLLDLYARKTPWSIIVVDFAQKIAEPFLSLYPVGCINIHPSLLPSYRGAAPIQRAIINGDSLIGVTVFRLVPEMDAGPTLISGIFPIGDEETFGEVAGKLAVEGSRLLLEGLELLRQGRISFKEQDHENVSFAPRISKSETELSWENPSQKVHDLVRGMNPVPGCFLFVCGKRLKVWKTRIFPASGKPGNIIGFHEGNPIVACRTGSVELIEVQIEGKKRAKGAEWIRGSSLKKGDMLI